MSIVEDAYDKFKDLPTGGKIAIAGAVAGVVYLGWRARQQLAATPTAATDQSTATDTPGSVTGTYPATGPTQTGTVGVPGPAGPPGKQGPPGTDTEPKPKPKPKPPGGGGRPRPKPTPAPRHQMNFYVVQHGDSLTAISGKLGLRGGWQALYNQNKSTVGSNPNYITPGEKLNITGLR